MKNKFLAVVFFSCLSAGKLNAQAVLPATYSSSVKINFVRSWDVKAPITNSDTVLTRSYRDVKQTTQYFDGLGRLLQTVVKKGSLVTGDTARDLVQPVLYDELGREQYQYLPFAANNTGSNTSISDGYFKLNAFQQDSTFNKGQFSGETYFYSKTKFEASILNRGLEVFAAGNSWVGTAAESSESDRRGIKTKQWVNTTADSVRSWDVTDISNSFGTYASSSIYAAGTLFKNVMQDEHDKQVILFKDKAGKLVLIKNQLIASADDGSGAGHYGWLCTYYIYDDLGNLRCVVQPRGVELLAGNSWSMSYSGGVILTEQCFRYEYDSKNRQIMKKVPGSGIVYMIYDARDRLVMMQDSVMRAVHQWLYTLYDGLSRDTATGIMTDNTYYNDAAYHRGQAQSSTAYPNTGSYIITELTKKFYDNYVWRAWEGDPLSATRSTSYDGYFSSESSNWPYYRDATVQSAMLAGMPTGTKTRVIGSSTFLYSVVFYDDNGRVIQTQSTNISGGTDVTATQYSWMGQPLLTIQKTEKAGTGSQTSVVLTQLSYDDLGRVTKTEKRVSNTNVNSGSMSGNWTTAGQREYDALGRLKTKKSGAVPLETFNYEYNIRGWILGMNRSYVKDTTSISNYFGFDLGYDKTSFTVNSTSLGYATAQYNGNINGMLWRSTGDDMLRKYDFTYDATKRFLSEDFNQLNSNSFNKAEKIDFSVSGMSYDANGNILTMNQKGWKMGGSVTIDSLAYGYISNSNRLDYVTDRANDANSKLEDFKETTNNTSSDYGYDVNGNVTADNNKAISSIIYNYLNLPDSIVVTGKGNIKYTYDAAGMKLRKVVREGSITTTTLFQGGAVYRNDTLVFIGTEEGRIRFNTANSTLQNDYFIKDHLGNVRMVLTEQKDTSVYPMVTFEDASTSNEQGYYDNANVGRTTRPGGFYNSTDNGSKVQQLDQATNKMGAGKLLKVMAKDRLHIKVDYYVENTTTNNTNANGLSSILTLLSSLIDNSTVTSGIHGTGSTITGDLNNSYPFTNFVSPQNGSGGTMPKAYLNIIFFDEQFKFVSTNSELIQVDTKGSGQTINRVSGSAKEAVKNGYVYVFVSNESNNLVYFDNLQISHERGPILEENHYYPFGLVQQGISSKALNFGNQKNRENTFQEQKFDDELGVNWIQFKWRNHDPQVGRFWQIDPLSEKYVYNSTYAFSENKVTGHRELEGLENVDVRYYVEKGIRQTEPNASEANIKKIMEAFDHGQAAGATTNLGIITDFIPYLNLAKWTYQMYTGKDIFTGEKLSTAEKTLMFIPVLGEFRGASSVWKMANSLERGLLIERTLGGNLPKNFPVIDRLLNGVAASIKSIDLTAKTYNEGNGLLNTLKGYINKLDNFTSATREGVKVEEGVHFTTKTLEIAIEPTKATLAQLEQIGTAMKYAQEKGINFVIQYVK